MNEIKYRKALIKKHIQAARLFKLKGLQDAYDREKELVLFIWKQTQVFSHSECAGSGTQNPLGGQYAGGPSG